VSLSGLKKKDDITFEIQIQQDNIFQSGHQPLSVIQINNESIITCRHLYDLNEEEEFSIHLSLRVITNRGLIHPDPKLFAFIHEGYIHLTDIKIFGNNQNKGYGSILIDKLKEIAIQKGIKKITGEISTVDFDHIDRLIHFYKKNDFIVDDSGSIEWEFK
jgi:ribosomal protein S18 acetylase RimI-like enzyme